MKPPRSLDSATLDDALVWQAVVGKLPPLLALLRELLDEPKHA